MSSGFTFAVPCSVPEYVHSKPNSTHSGDKGGEKRREGRLMILSSQGMGPSKTDVGNFIRIFHKPSPISVVFQDYPSAILTNFRPLPLQLPTSFMDGPNAVADEDGKATEAKSSRMSETTTGNFHNDRAGFVFLHLLCAMCLLLSLCCCFAMPPPPPPQPLSRHTFGSLGLTSSSLRHAR